MVRTARVSVELPRRLSATLRVSHTRMKKLINSGMKTPPRSGHFIPGQAATDEVRALADEKDPRT